MNKNFSIETFVREHHRLSVESALINSSAVIASNDFDFSDYLSFLAPPKNAADVKKYVAANPAIELREIISVHQPIECKNLINTGIIDSIEKQYLSDFDFHLLNFYFDVRPKNNFKLQSVAVTAKFNDFFVPELRPRVISYFPTPELFRECQNVSGKVIVSGGKGFQFINEREYDEKKHKTSDVDFIYDYNATRKSVFAAQTGSGFFFKFFVGENSLDTQTFRVRAILLRPRGVKKILMNANFMVNEFPIEYNYVTELPVEESKF